MLRNRSSTNTKIVRVPLAVRRRGGRKTIIPVTVCETTPQNPRDAFVLALAKSYRWRKQIEAGEFQSITELARANGINDSYACRVLRLSLVAPDLVEQAIASQIVSQKIAKIFWKVFPVFWPDQHDELEI